MPDIKQFRDDIWGALTDRDNARDDLFRQLMEMEPQERTKLSPSLFARLTQQQLLNLVGGKLNETAIISPPAPETLQAIRKSGNQKFKVSSPSRSACKSGLLVATLGGAIVILGLMVGPYTLARLARPPTRSVDASQWPACPRLDAQTDGCVYTVQDSVSWAGAAALLQMPESTLRSANQNTQILAPGTSIIVWRGRGTLLK